MIRTNTAPSIGPLLGAILTAYCGWRWIFWSLSILSGICWLAFAVSYPETARSIVGDGSNQVNSIYRSPLKTMQPPAAELVAPCLESTSNRARFSNPLAALRTLRSLDTMIIVLCVAIFYSVYTILQVPLSIILTPLYSLNQTEAGLIYLPFGVGCMVSAFTMGKRLQPAAKTN